MSRRSRYLCGVPGNECTGATTAVSQGLGTSRKTHGTPEDAFACKENSLLAQGYIKIGTTEFKKEGEPILVLSSPRKYGGKLRLGKEGNRFMPANGTGIVIV